MPMPDEIYIFTTIWSEQDQKFWGFCDKYPHMIYSHESESEARQGIIDLVTMYEEADRLKRGNPRKRKGAK